MSQKSQIKTTNKAIFEGADTLYRVANIASLPVRLKCEFGALIHEFRKYSSIANGVRDNLIAKYARINPETNSPLVDERGKMSVDPAKFIEYNKELMELANQEVIMEAHKIVVPEKDIPEEVTGLQMGVIKDFVTFKTD